MGRGGQGERKRSLCWTEVEQHTTKADRWIVIDGEVYDVTAWSMKHPGGPRMIGHYAGQDATEAFAAFHNNVKQVAKYLKPMHIGSVRDKTDLDMDRDFRTVRDVATTMGLFEPSYTFFGLMLGHILFMQLAAYLLLLWWSDSWLAIALSIVLCASAQTQAGWIQHDFGHLSVFKNTKLDHLFHHLTMGLLKGASASWWNHLHYQHHAKPNVIDKDPDVRIDTLFVVGDVIPVQVAKTRKKSMPYNWQHRYFFALGPPLLFPVYFQIMFLRFVCTRKKWMELGIVIAFFTWFLCLHVPILGIPGTLAYFYTFRIIESNWFTWVAQSNHLPMHIENDDANPWLKLQLQASCNVEKSFFNDWFTGHLNFQVEHHLFPTMPRHNLHRISSLVKSLCETHGMPYIVKPIWQSFVDIVSALKTSGKLWEETYKEFHTS